MNSPRACIGWRKSWLAAARKRDLARLARFGIFGALAQLQGGGRNALLQIAARDGQVRGHLVDAFRQLSQGSASFERNAGRQVATADVRHGGRDAMDRIAHRAAHQYGQSDTAGQYEGPAWKAQ